MTSPDRNTSPRERWKAKYRAARIFRRIANEVALDTVIFGTGFLYIGMDGIRSISPEEVRYGRG